MLNLIEHLPRASYFREAYSLDEDIAEQMAGLEIPERTERLSEWTPEREAIAAAVDAINNLVYVTTVGIAGKASRPSTFPRPEMAVQRVRDRRDAEKYRDLVDRITPKR